MGLMQLLALPFQEKLEVVIRQVLQVVLLQESDCLSHPSLYYLWHLSRNLLQDPLCLKDSYLQASINQLQVLLILLFWDHSVERCHPYQGVLTSIKHRQLAVMSPLWQHLQQQLFLTDLLLYSAWGLLLLQYLKWKSCPSQKFCHQQQLQVWCRPKQELFHLLLSTSKQVVFTALDPLYLLGSSLLLLNQLEQYLQQLVLFIAIIVLESCLFEEQVLLQQAQAQLFLLAQVIPVSWQLSSVSLNLLLERATEMALSYSFN